MNHEKAGTILLSAGWEVWPQTASCWKPAPNFVPSSRITHSSGFFSPGSGLFFQRGTISAAVHATQKMAYQSGLLYGEIA